MANHPITMIPPAQIIQSAAAANNDHFSSSNNSSLPAGSQGETSTGVGGSTEASVTVAPGAMAPDLYAMQASDATSFVFGSTATNQAAVGNQYTTVSDTAKSTTQAKIQQDRILAPIGQEGSRRPLLRKKKNPGDLDEESEDGEESTSTNSYSADAKKILARAMEKGLPII